VLDRPHITGSPAVGAAPEASPILLVPYTWIGDFVRCHSVVKLLKAQMPQRPVDVLTSSLCLPLLDYMDGVRKGIVADLPHGKLALRTRHELAKRLRQERYGQAIVTSRSWKSALAPFLAGIPVRTGFFGEARLGVINDLRFGEKKLSRMVDRSAALALPPGAAPPTLPLPELKVPAAEATGFLRLRGLEDEAGRAVALAPGSHASPSKRWPVEHYSEVARTLAARGTPVWVLGGPQERALAQQIAAGAAGLPAQVHDLTGTDLRQAVLALASAGAAISNDSGLLHVAAALGTPTIGIFGPTSAWHWAPLNPLHAVVEPQGAIPCRPCHKPTCRFGHHRCMREIGVADVLSVVRTALPAQPLSPRL
jgi:heptosyltransferase-2